MRQYTISKKVSVLLTGALLLTATLQLSAENLGKAEGEIAPSAAQIENALRLGERFQGMAYQQLTPSGGLPISPTYVYPNVHYLPVVPVYPLAIPYYYPPTQLYYGYRSPYYSPPPYYPLRPRFRY